MQRAEEVCSDALADAAFARDSDGALVVRLTLLSAEPEQAPRYDTSAGASTVTSDADGDLELPRRSANEGALRAQLMLFPSPH